MMYSLNTEDRNFFISLIFHRIVKHEPKCWTDVSMNTFLYIASCLNEFKISSNSVFDYKLGRSIGLTFDDGNSSDYEVVFPELLKANIKGTFFVITDLIGKKGYLSWDNLREMSEYGMIIGSHTCSHRNLAGIPKREKIFELENSKKNLEDNLQCDIKTISYPFGSFDRETTQIAQKTGYQFAYSSIPGAIQLENFLIPRVSINCNYGKSKINSLMLAGHGDLAKMRISYQSRRIIKTIISDKIYKMARNWYKQN